jgi:hypothetical protein
VLYTFIYPIQAELGSAKTVAALALAAATMNRKAIVRLRAKGFI